MESKGPANTNLAISPRNLGLILLETYCAFCFWLLLRVKFHMPFEHGGALWTYLQQIEEAQITHHLEKNGCLPKEFSPFCDISTRADFPHHWSKFRYEHKSGVTLYGVPDEIFTLADGSLCVIDHKSAINKGEGDPFLPIYHAQTIGYADIAQNGLKLGNVTKAGLFYWEVLKDEAVADPAGHYEKGKVWVPFRPKPLEFDVDFAFLDSPLKEAKKLWRADAPPAGREGCSDCVKLKALFELGSRIDAADQLQDQRILASCGNSRDAVQLVSKRIYDRRLSRLTALQELHDGAADFQFAKDGMAGNWLYFGDEC